MNSRRRKRRIDELDSDSEREDFILEREALMGQCDSIWDVVEWGCHRSSQGWIDLIGLIVRILRNDLDGVQNGA